MLQSLILLSGIAEAKAEDRCAAYPDPHFKGFDGFYYDFHFPCDFTLATTPNADLSVQVRLSRAVGSAIALIEGVAIKSVTDFLALEGASSATTSVYLNGVAYAGPYPFTLGSATVALGSSDEYVVSFAGTTDSIHVTKFYGSFSVELNGQGADSVFWGATGLCGHYNGDPADDLTGADGSVVDIMTASQPQINAFGWTWAVDAADSLFSTKVECVDTAPIPCGGRDGTTAAGAIRENTDCKMTREDAKAKCLNVAGVELASEPALLEDCIEDLRETGDPAWARNPVYNTPMRCGSTCECTNLHPKAQCLDRCLIDHDCINVCPDKRCTCNVPKKIKPSLTCDETTKIIDSGASFASLVGPTIGTSPKLCKIVDATACATCACDYYVKYSPDGGATWLGLTFAGTPGGTGCPAGPNTLNNAVNWLKTKYIGQGYCCGPGTGIPCEKVKEKPTTAAGAAALVGPIVGDAPKLCKIVDATKCTTCACKHYVRYSTDNGATWLGLNFMGNPGGTGCPAPGVPYNMGATATDAVNWLYDKYIANGYCCGTSHTPCDEILPTTPAASLIGPIIGTGSKVCKIFEGCPTCACKYYVRYSTDGGATWQGLTFGGAPGMGGTGCPHPSYPSTAAGAVQWLKDKYIPKYCCLQGLP